jgi:hypothetical protein
VTTEDQRGGYKHEKKKEENISGVARSAYPPNQQSIRWMNRNPSYLFRPTKNTFFFSSNEYKKIKKIKLKKLK